MLRNLSAGVLAAIMMTACGGGGGSPGTNPNQPPPVSTGPTVATILLSSTSGIIQSAGVEGSEVTIKAVVKDTNNNVVPGATVTFSTDSGDITGINPISDATGLVTAKLSIGGDPTTRLITVTAKAAGAISKTTTVNVVGTKLVINASAGVNINTVSDISVTLKDSAGSPLKGKPVTFSAITNTLTVKSGGAAITDSSGQLILSFAANSGTSDTVSVTALGEKASAPIKINTSNFNVKVVSGSTVLTESNTNTCQTVSIHHDDAGVPQSGAVSLNSSLGSVFSDAGCATSLSTPIALDGSGNATAYIQASTPGLATLNAILSSTGTIAQGTIEFIAPLTSIATISLQPDFAIIGTNTSSSTAQQSTFRAVVRDGTGQNNLVKNARVNFSIVSDPSGGRLQQPSVATTGSDGSASVVYIAGATSTAVNGVQIQAQIQGASTAATIATLTVSKQSLFISAGTGNTVATPTSATYQVDYAVFVTDASGNAVSGANVVAAVWPSFYSKGYWAVVNYPGSLLKHWVQMSLYTCPNEDVNRNGILDAGEDFNGNGRLDPGIPVTVTSTGKTDATGSATISLVYPRDRAAWLYVDMTITGSVAGTEARYIASFTLPGLGSDYNNTDISPPGQVSPYGVKQCSSPG
ncbi:MAG: Ig-like group 1 domain-containing protein [Glaciimonas sp.]|nr:Ig-like group 1 domain-containing protein [Glaciimonas sp.]